MAKPILVFPAKKALPADDVAKVKTDAVDRGYPTVNGKQAIGRAVVSSPIRDAEKRVIGYETKTTYKLEDGTEITLDDNGNEI